MNVFVDNEESFSISYEWLDRIGIRWKASRVINSKGDWAEVKRARHWHWYKTESDIRNQLAYEVDFT